MIIEIFGPPCVGKTTLAHALTARLREQGLKVELALSYRPSELSPGAMANSPDRRPLADAARRLTRPVVEMLATGGDLFGKSPEAVTATTLLALLPPRNILWSARLRQYIWRRAHLWNASQQPAGIAIFDQAFIQVVYSLAVLGAPVNERQIAQALDAVPMPDLLVRLEAPFDLVKSRLIERRRRQGTIERLLEVDLQTTLESLGVIDRLHELLHERGQSVICVDSADPHSLDGAVEQLEREVMARFAPAEAAA